MSKKHSNNTMQENNLDLIADNSHHSLRRKTN